MDKKIIDTELAKMVFGDSEEMYKKYLFQLEERNLYGQMEAYLDEGNVQKAFETAHTMKGLVQNLALADFSVAIGALVEVMRDGSMPSAQQRKETREKYDEVVEYLEYVRENQITILQ